MRKIKVFVAIFSLLLSISVCANISNFDSSNDMELTVLTRTRDAIDKMLASDFDYGFSRTLDITQLELGEKIYAYEYIDDKFELLSLSYYPIVYDNHVIALSLAEYVDNDILVQVTTTLSDEIDDYMATHTCISLLFADSGVFAFDGNAVGSLVSYPEQVSYRSHININSDSNIFEDIEVSTFFSDKKIYSGIMMLDAPTYKDLDVPIVVQYNEDGTTNDNICWACCVASVGEYKTGIDKYDGQGVCKFIYGNTSTTGSLDDVPDALKRIYNLNYRLYQFAPSFEAICGFIQDNDPIIGILATESYYGHTVVVCGWWTNTVTKYCTVMDPYYETYQLATVDSTGAIYYTLPLYGRTYKLTAFYK